MLVMLIGAKLFFLPRQNQLYRRMGNKINNQGEKTAAETGSSITIKNQLSSQKQNIAIPIPLHEKRKILSTKINEDDMDSSQQEDPKSHLQRKNERILRIVKTIVGGEFDFCKEQVLMGIITDTHKQYEQKAEKQRKMAERGNSLYDYEPQGEKEKISALKEIVKRKMQKRQQCLTEKTGERHLL